MNQLEKIEEAWGEASVAGRKQRIDEWEDERRMNWMDPGWPTREK